jgi:uncharacterized protein
MRSSDLPLLLAAGLSASGGEPYPLDRVRMQKAVFLLVERGGGGFRGLYKYRPYNWGPYSDDLASDLRALEAAGYIGAEAPATGRYGQYTLTPAGEIEAGRVWANLSEVERSFVAEVRRYVTHSSFSKLLREVYAAHPEYATASQFRG